MRVPSSELHSPPASNSCAQSQPLMNDLKEEIAMLQSRYDEIAKRQQHLAEQDDSTWLSMPVMAAPYH
eukprot:2349245-Amphidinium_carterae.4